MSVVDDNLGNDSKTDLCCSYGDQLQEISFEDNQISEFRSQWPEKFRALCFLQLSFLIDVPLDLFHEFRQLEKRDVTFSAFRRFLSRSRTPSDSKLYLN